MKKYRIVELSNGFYSVQVRHWLFWWKLLPINASYQNAAYAHIVDLKHKERERIKIKKGLKVKKVHGYS
jgi:hypothetical protein